MTEGISKENVLLTLYKKKRLSNRDWLYTREIAEELTGGKPKEKEIMYISKILLRQRRAGRAEALNGCGNGGGNKGKKLKHALTENGWNYAEILYKSDWYCENCQDFVEAVKKPTCKNCGTPVHREKKS